MVPKDASYFDQYLKAVEQFKSGDEVQVSVKSDIHPNYAYFMIHDNHVFVIGQMEGFNSRRKRFYSELGEEATLGEENEFHIGKYRELLNGSGDGELIDHARRIFREKGLPAWI